MVRDRVAAGAEEKADVLILFQLDGEGSISRNISSGEKALS